MTLYQTLYSCPTVQDAADFDADLVMLYIQCKPDPYHPLNASCFVCLFVVVCLTAYLDVSA